MEFVGIFLHWIYFPGCMMWIKLILMLACIDGLEDVEQQQVFQRSQLPKQYILQNKLTFKVLQQPSICSYRNLTSCHTDSHLHEAYYEQCYSDACPKEKYFCLNNPSGNTIHLCGQAYTWKKRSRNIAVFDTVLSNYVDVYRIDCPLGYFQSNRRNAFTKCVKDESLVIVQNATDQRRALGRCNSKKKYCSTKGVTLFELGSDKDVCLDAKYDLNITCSETAELMPNCNCVPKCRTFEEREWSGSFMCRSIGEHATDPGGTPQHRERITQVTESNKPSSGHTVHQTNKQVDIGIKNQDRELSVVENERQNTGDNKSFSTPAFVAIAMAVAIVMIAVVISIVCLAYKLLRERDNRGGPVLYNRTEDQSDEDSEHHYNGITSGPVINKKSKKVTNNTNYFQANGDVHVHPGNGHAIPNINSKDIDCESGSSRCGAASVDGPKMENLKVRDLSHYSIDTGMVNIYYSKFLSGQN